jgi:hypothetical protein
MTITVVQYRCGNPSSVPLKQSRNNAITNVPRGMPQKFRNADGSTTFSLGRNVYVNAPQCHSIIAGKTPFSSIRVDTQADVNCKETIQNTGWSHTNITISGQRRNALYSNTSQRCCENGKMSIVSSGDEYIERKKNRAIGKGSNPNPQNNYPLSFQGNEARMVATQARRKARSSGYVVPPKCRGGGLGGGCGQPGGWAVTPLFHGRDHKNN